MGRLFVNMFMSLDGVIQSPGMPDEDRDGGFDHGGWQVPYFDEESGQYMVGQMASFDALLLGRTTYEIFAGYWPHAPAGDPIADKLNSVPKYVASRTLDTVEWNNSALLTGDLAAEVARLKEQHSEINVTGSAGLVQSLRRENLVDQYNLWIYPVVLGTGKRLFAEGTVPSALELVDSRVFGNGALVTAYRPVGKPQYGSTALDAEQSG